MKYPRLLVVSVGVSAVIALAVAAASPRAGQVTLRGTWTTLFGASIKLTSGQTCAAVGAQAALLAPGASVTVLRDGLTSGRGICRLSLSLGNVPEWDAWILTVPTRNGATLLTTKGDVELESHGWTMPFQN